MKNIWAARVSQIVIGLALGGFMLAGGPAANAATMAQMEARIATLENTVNNQQLNIAKLQNSSVAYQNAITALISNINYIKTHPTAGPAGPAGPIGPKGISGLTAQQQAALGLMTVNGKDLTVTGNLHIVNGLGATNGEPTAPQDIDNPVTNGLGNLIVGYNQSRTDTNNPDVRTGSHNLIVGDYNNFSSFGGVVMGFSGTNKAPWASVLGGVGNTVAGICSTVSGGSHNTAAGKQASVTGGVLGQANGDNSNITGGFNNRANGDISSIDGGENILTAKPLGWAAGGSYISGFGDGYFAYNP